MMTNGTTPWAARFWLKVSRGAPNECWTWTAAKAAGYGRFGWYDRATKKSPSALAHRLSYQLLVGPIPDGLQLDHLCRNRACVNPAHLEPVTQQENIRRGENGVHEAAKTRCPKGHAYDDANTLVRKKRTGATQRVCLACKRVWRMRSYQKLGI